MDKSNKWYMAGTEGSGKYLVIASNGRGRIGLRLLISGQVRIRIEPTEQSAAGLARRFTAEAGWKQPTYGQRRFSKVCGRREAIREVCGAIQVLRRSGKLEYQPKIRLTWRARLLLG